MGLHRVSGWFVNHDYRHTGHVELVVERDTAPSGKQAEELLWSLADADTERRFPGESGGRWRNEFTSVTVRPQPRLGVADSAGALGALVLARLAHLAATPVASDGALRGVDVLLLAGPSSERAATDAGAQHIVSVSSCGTADGESTLRESGVAYTMLWTSVVVDELVESADADGVIRGPAGDGRVAAVARADVADVAATVLSDPGRHAGLTYTLTGPEALTLTEITERASAVLGRPLSYQASTDAPQWWRSGSCAEVTGDIEAVRGWRARTLEEALT